MQVIVAGGGIGGLVLALQLHARGIQAQVYEQASAVRELGVGINTLPHAIAELEQLGLLGIAVCFAYVSCGAIRLARTDALDRRPGPRPVSGLWRECAGGRLRRRRDDAGVSRLRDDGSHRRVTGGFPSTSNATFPVGDQGVTAREWHTGSVVTAVL